MYYGFPDLKKLKKIKSPLPTYLFLLATFPTLFLYSSNINELRVEVIVLPIISILALTLILFLFFTWLFKNQNKAGLFLSASLMLFFSYGHIHTLLGDINYSIGGFVIGTDKLLFTVWAIILLLIFYFLAKLPLKSPVILKSLTIVAGLLITFSIINIVSYEVQTGRIFKSQENITKYERSDETNFQLTESPPDIYYLIFDRYAGQKTLKGFYDYDNSDFLNYLESKGFFIARNSTSNYPKTSQSLASSLNMRYINYLGDEVGKDVPDETILYPIIENNEVVHLLKQNGYKYIHLGSHWEPTRINNNADENLTFSPNLLNLGDFQLNYSTPLWLPRY